MVRAKLKKHTTSSNKTLENEVADNDLAETKTTGPVSVNVEQPKAGVQFEDKVNISLDQAKNETNEGTEEKDDENMTEMNGDNLAEEDQNTSEDDEVDCEEDVIWEDDEENSEEDNEENAVDKDEVSAEVETEEDEEESEEDEEESEEDDEESKEDDDENEHAEEEKELASEDGGKSEELIIEKVEASLKEEVKSGGRSRKIVETRSLKKVKSGDIDKPESSRKRKAKKKVESMGMIFMCSSSTKNDCYRYRVLGLPATKKNMVEKIYTGMRLFLYDVDLKLLNGIYKAAGPGGFNIEPKAFKSQFPSQVRFTVLNDCLPIAEEKFKKIIKDNYFTKTKFDCLLTSEQVKKLCKLFVASSKGQRHKKLGRNHKAENHTTVRRDRPRKQRVDEERRHAMREELAYRERPRKRRRKISTPVAPVRQPLHLSVPVPLPYIVPSYAYERTSEVDAYRQYPYLESRDPYQDVRDPLLHHGGSYRDRQDPPTERRGYYRDGRDPPTERRGPHRDERDSYQERRSPYRDGRDLYAERRDHYRYGRDLYVERRSPYKDGRDTYVERHDPYSDRRDSYLQNHGPSRDGPQSEPYGTDRRDPILDRRDVYREAPLAGARDLQPTHLETRWLHDIGSREAYVSYRARPSYAEPTYSAEYPSRAGLEHNYRPVSLLTDHSSGGRLPEYYSRRA